MNTLIEIQEGLVGDSLCTLPVIDHLSKQFPGAHLWMANNHVRQLIPETVNVVHVADRPNRSNYDRVFATNIGSAFMPRHGLGHMTAAYFWQLLGQDSREPVRPSIRTQPAARHFDFVISPYSASGPDSKQWPLDNWAPVIAELQRHGSVCVVGSSSGTYRNQSFSICENVFDAPLTEVADMLQQARAVITIDNGISHLAYAAGAKHFLLYPKILPLCWVRNPDALVMVQEDPQKLPVKTVLDGVGALLHLTS